MPRRIAKLLISLAVVIFDGLVAGIRRLFGGKAPARGVVLYYHSVKDVERQRFAAQMDMLVRLTVPVDIASGAPLSQKSARYSAVTFDDGFMSVVRNALPELRERNIPCMIFVPTGSLGNRPGWIGPSHVDADEVLASPEVLREIVADGLVRLGSHSVSHPNFRRLDDEKARAELSSSKATLESILGEEVGAFSFPHGAYTQRSLELAKQCGYTRIYTIEPLQLSDPSAGYTVGRVKVDPHDWPLEFRLKVLGGYRWMPRVSAFKRQLRDFLRGGRVGVPQPGGGV